MLVDHLGTTANINQYYYALYEFFQTLKLLVIFFKINKIIMASEQEGFFATQIAQKG